MRRLKLFLWITAALLVTVGPAFSVDEKQMGKVPETGKEMDRIQKQLDDVILANQRLQEEYLRRMEKIRALSGQAKIHRDLLEKIRLQSGSEASPIRQAVRQEKIRLIAEQTRKNQELLKTLRREEKSTP